MIDVLIHVRQRIGIIKYGVCIICGHKDLCCLHIPGLLAGSGTIQAGLGAFIQVKGVKKGACCLIAPYVI